MRNISREDAERVTVAIPCRNEARSVAAVVRAFARELPGARVVVLDNGSTDGTADEARTAGAEVLSVRSAGKGNAVRAAIGALSADCLLLIDGDGTYDPADAPAMVAPVLHGRADVVSGERFTRAGRGAFVPLRRSGNRVLTAVVNAALGTRSRDVLSGYKALSRAFLSRAELHSTGFEIETEILCVARRSGGVVVEVPVRYEARRAGAHSKLVPVRDAARIVATAIRLRPR